ncbi:ammonia-dependent NAD(+) synthetase [Pseudomonas rubra]|uniref:NH(3)-dependent NAD(+) synthetase n=1 Tax=Pseudomonas rubra TaxID=2942627 RepID=A0ABT5PBL0_9PSED|nr:ammonia-dependent NAD(+) synthetase [Pseudomonas rubra]MDD1015686.1 ammonia-dependent NAD(+) synthetase [Pseudomonas rubra]MDD1040308.1 ammonia-dependent NAD(+) synthetase [Pseudomonas rubra]MDD1153899.1 ammonia-dependent NAD(+) synthetase [Pseudomonas rubra]
MNSRQIEIAKALGVVAPFAEGAAVEDEIRQRIDFIKQTLLDARLKVLVLGISGGVDSSTAGRLAQLAVQALRNEHNDPGYRFIAMRLPHNSQHDEADAQAALAFVDADECVTVNIADGVAGLAGQLPQLDELAGGQRDFVLGNVKARMRMLAQYTLANARNGLVIGTDHAAEAVMGFFTKFGDGACDLAPLTGLCKGQVRAIAAALGAPEHLVHKVPTADLEELRPGLADEQVYGVSYAQIDAFLQGEQVSEAIASTIINAYDKTLHKRQLPKAPARGFATMPAL